MERLPVGAPDHAGWLAVHVDWAGLRCATQENGRIGMPGVG
jgi:hypothetical protein